MYITQKYLRNGFKKYTNFLINCPFVSFLIFSICIYLSTKAINVYVETSVEELWVPSNSINYQRSNEMDELYEYDSFQNKLVVTLKENNPNKIHNLLDYQALYEYSLLMEEILAIEVIYNNNTYKYQDICFKEYGETDCAITSILSISDYSISGLDALFFTDVFHSTLYYAHQTSSLNFILTDMIIDNNRIINATATASHFPLDHSFNSKIRDLWQSKFINLVTTTDTSINDNNELLYPDLKVSGLAHRSFDDETKKLITSESILFGISVISIFIFLLRILGENHVVKSRYLLAFFASLLTVLPAIGASFGIMKLLNKSVNSICFTMPFILAGISVDDMIIIVDAVNRYRHIDDIKERMCLAISESGLAITITSLTNVLAFSVGTFVSVPGIQAFSYVSAIAFFIDYLLQLSVFITLLYYDEIRISQKRQSCFICKKYDQVSIDTNTNQQISHKLITTCFNPIIFYNIASRLFILLLFITSSIWSIMRINDIVIGLHDLDIVPDNSYIVTTYEIMEQYWNGFGMKVKINLQNINYTNYQQRQQVYNLIESYENYTGYTIDSWLLDYNTSYANLYPNQLISATNDSDINDVLPTNITFYDHLITFLNNEAKYQPFINFDTNYTFITSSMFQLPIMLPANSKDRITIKNDLNKLIEQYDLQGYSYIDVWMFTDLDDIIMKLSVKNMIYVIIAATMLLLFLVPLIQLIAIIISVAMIDIHLLHMMVLWSINLNAVSLVTLIMSIGLSIDYCVHMGHAFDQVQMATDKIDQAKQAIHYMGKSVLKGAFTTILGVAILAFSKSNAFRTFFKMAFGTIIFSVVHSMIFLPVLLSFILPVRNKVDDDDDDDDDDDKQQPGNGNDQQHKASEAVTTTTTTTTDMDTTTTTTVSDSLNTSSVTIEMTSPIKQRRSSISTLSTKGFHQAMKQKRRNSMTLLDTKQDLIHRTYKLQQKRKRKERRERVKKASKTMKSFYDTKINKCFLFIFIKFFFFFFFFFFVL